MNQRVKNELSILTFLGAFALRHRYPKSSAALALSGMALRFAPPANPYSFRDKSVVITGGSRGLGLALATRLMREGAAVTLLARDTDELARAKAQLSEIASGRVHTFTCDLTHLDQLRSAFRTVLKREGKIDVLINNAGSITVGPFECMNQLDFKAQMDLHLFAIINATREIVPHFRKNGGGRLVNISSIGGKIPVPHMTAYCASKFALSGFSKSVAAELRPYGIQITTVYPGLMRTGSPIQATFKGDHEKEYAWFAASDMAPGLSISAEGAAEQILEATRRGDPELVTTVPAKVGTFVYNNFPALTEWTLQLAATLLPNGKSRRLKTGAKSRKWLDNQSWAKPLVALGRDAEEKLNQKEKSDAAFNAGLH